MTDILWKIILTVAGIAAIIGLRMIRPTNSRYNPSELGKDFTSILDDKKKPKNQN
jgi:hypothetical protein